MFSIHEPIRHTERKRLFALSLLTTLLISTLIFSSNVQPASAATITVPDQYPTIQEAINAASNGDTINVHAGTYNEWINITKSLSLIGESQATTIINEITLEGKDQVTVSANGVFISNFTIQGNRTYLENPPPDYYVDASGIRIDGYNDTTVRNTKLNYNEYGIRIAHAFNTVLIDNYVTGNINGIIIDISSTITLKGNQISYNYGYAGVSLRTGIGLGLTDCYNAVLRQNNLIENGNDFGIGGQELGHFLHDIDTSNLIVNGTTKKIYYLVNQHDITIDPSTYPDVGFLGLVNSSNIQVRNISFVSNDPGILMAYTNNSVLQNTTVNSCIQCVLLLHSSNNTIAQNNFKNSNHDVFKVRFCSNNTFSDNVMSANLGVGMHFYNSSENMLGNNVIADQPDGGLDFEYSDNNTLIGNNITNCEHGGIYLYYSSNGTLHKNLMQNNDINFRVTAYFDTTLWQFNHDIDPSNLINGKHLYYLVNHNNEIVDPTSYPDAAFLGLVNSTGVTVQNLQLQGMLVCYTNSSVIQQNTIQGPADGITMVKSQANSIQENTISGTDGLELWDRSHGNNINGNNVKNASEGVSIRWYSENNTVTQNQLLDNFDNGIDVDDYSAGTAVTNNNLTSNGWNGVRIGYGCHFSVVTGNNATGNGEDGIGLFGSDNSTATNNYISGNRYNGIRFDNSGNGIISGNIIRDHGNIGISFSYASYNNLITGNDIRNSTVDGIEFFALPANNTAIGNNITDSGEDGIHIELSGIHTIKGNNIANSGRDGIYVEGYYTTDYPEYTAAFGALNNNITDNIVLQSGRYGIYMLGYNNSIYHNRFVGFSQATYSDADHHDIWDDGYPSGGNYWSNYNGTDLYQGPNQDIPGGDGIGDTPYLMNANNTDHYPLMQTAFYSIAINAHCNTQSADISVPITKDAVPLGQNTPYTFTSLLGTHNFTVPVTDSEGHPFKQWNTGQNTTIITVNATGTYTAIYEAPPPLTYNITINAHCNTEAKDISVAISRDGTPSGHNTSYTFTGLTLNHTFTVPSVDANGHPFKQWNTGAASTTINVTSGDNYTAIYEGTTPPPQTYNVTIKAYCNTQHSYIHVAILKDDKATCRYTPYTFVGLTGNHTFAVPNKDSSGHPFKQWSTGQTSTTITVSNATSLTAYYQAPTPPPCFNFHWRFPIWIFRWHL